MKWCQFIEVKHVKFPVVHRSSPDSTKVLLDIYSQRARALAWPCGTVYFRLSPGMRTIIAKTAQDIHAVLICFNVFEWSSDCEESGLLQALEVTRDLFDIGAYWRQITKWTNWWPTWFHSTMAGSSQRFSMITGSKYSDICEGITMYYTHHLNHLIQGIMMESWSKPKTAHLSTFVSFCIPGHRGHPMRSLRSLRGRATGEPRFTLQRVSLRSGGDGDQRLAVQAEGLQLEARDLKDLSLIWHIDNTYHYLVTLPTIPLFPLKLPPNILLLNTLLPLNLLLLLLLLFVLWFKSVWPCSAERAGLFPVDFSNRAIYCKASHTGDATRSSSSSYYYCCCCCCRCCCRCCRCCCWFRRGCCCFCRGWSWWGWWVMMRCSVRARSREHGFWSTIW